MRSVASEDAQVGAGNVVPDCLNILSDVHYRTALIAKHSTVRH
jgi:hypothetical protein